MKLSKLSLTLIFQGLAFLVSAQVNIGIHPGIGIGCNAPESFTSGTRYNTCSGKGQIKYSTFLTGPQLYFKRSENNGLQWQDSILVYTVPSATSTMVNSRRINTEPRIACDLSESPFSNRIYIVWSDLKNGKNNLDVFLVYSDDQGNHWTEPILLTYRPNHKHQLLPDIAVDGKTGEVNILYADQQNFTDEKHCDLQVASSTNGGLKFTSQCINSEALTFSASLHPRLVQTEWGLKAIWSAGKKAVVSQEVSGTQSNRGKSGIGWEKNTYVYTKSLILSFDLLMNGKLSAELSKPLDASFRKMLFKKKKHKKGKNSLSLEPYFLNLPEDSYILTLYNENGNSYVWILPE